MNLEHKLFAVYFLKRLAMADQTFQISEQQYADTVAAQLNIDSSIVYNLDPATFETSNLPAREQDRMTILYYLLFLSQADGMILDEEKIEIRKIGFELGFRDTQIVKMIEVIENDKGKQINPEKLIDVIRIVLN